MPSKSARQHRFMLLSASPEGRRWLRRHGITPVPVKVAKEFLRADERTKRWKRKGKGP